MIRKLTISIGALGAIIVPIATTISCKSKYPLYATPGTLRKNYKERFDLNFKKVKTLVDVDKKWKELVEELTKIKDQSDIVLLIIKGPGHEKHIFKFHAKQWDKYPGLKSRIDKLKKEIIDSLPKK